jgi:putative mRNA 3-end processing factor
LITHAHADHARPGCGEYWAVDSSEAVLRQRLGQSINLHPVRYGKEFWLGQCKVSFHSAGHVLGSAQIRLESDGNVWVVSGDYKRDHDPSCAPFETVACDVLITGSHIWVAHLSLEQRSRSRKINSRLVAG